jgi:hypothetical protein
MELEEEAGEEIKRSFFVMQNQSRKKVGNQPCSSIKVEKRGGCLCKEKGMVSFEG